MTAGMIPDLRSSRGESTTTKIGLYEVSR